MRARHRVTLATRTFPATWYLLHVSPVAHAPRSRKNTESHGTLTASSLKLLRPTCDPVVDLGSSGKSSLSATSEFHSISTCFLLRSIVHLPALAPLVELSTVP